MAIILINVFHIDGRPGKRQYREGTHGDLFIFVKRTFIDL
jgi:hypothetical protein